MAQTTSTASLTPQSFYQSTLSGSITASDTTIPINSLPTANEGYLVLESTSATAREIIHYTSKTGSAVVCGSVGDRGLFGTTAQAHSSGALVEDNWVTGYWLDLQSQVATTSATTLQRHLANPTEGQFGNNFVSSGYGLTGASSSLVATLASGIAYVAGSRVLAAVGGHTYPANSDIFVDVNSSGSLTFVGSGSSNISGASVPITSNSIRLARVNTHATGINSITQTGVDIGGNLLYNNRPSTRGMLLWRQGANAGDAAWNVAGTTNTDVSAKSTFMQTGNVSTNGSNATAVTFPIPFSQPPMVLASYSGVGSNFVAAEAFGVTTTGFSVDTAQGGARVAASGVAWIAVGQ